MERRTFALLLAYDGGPYKGWQPHPALPTVGGVVSGALRRLGIGATPYGASRTDAGVHADGQVASFHSRPDLDLAWLLPAMNEELPSTVRLRAVALAPPSFHSHWSSRGKIYRYRVSTRPEPRAACLPWVGERLDLARLLGALRTLAFADDLARFARRGERDEPVRTVSRFEVVSLDRTGLTLEVAGPAFGKYMVRNLVAAVLSVACGELPPEALEGMLAGSHPIPRRAPAEGLTLRRVCYPRELTPFPLESACR